MIAADSKGLEMTLYQNKYRIESSRLTGWDYSSPGYYFVTICAHERQCIFGKITDGTMMMNENGKIVSDCIDQIPGHFENVKNDTWIVMPNHVHGIIRLVESSNSGISRRDVACRDVACRDVACNVSTTHIARIVCRDVACNVSTDGSTNNTPNQCNMAAISPKPNSLSTIIRSFKSSVSNQMHAHGFVGKVWQPRFHDHIIRHDRELCAIRHYIKNNPQNWPNDRNVIEREDKKIGKQPWFVYLC